MNIVSLIGRLTADPELKHTQSGTAMTRFTIAVDRNFTKQGEERQADFITIIAWQQRAEMVCRYFTKGNRIGIVGEIRTGSFTDRDGNKRYTTEVWANSVDFCESKNSGSGYGSGSGTSGQGYRRAESSDPAPSYSSGDNGDFYEAPASDDLPF